jgi:transcriptional regulator with XRE-family HTH domain
MARTKDTTRGERVRERREAAGLTQAEVAQMMTADERTVQSWEAGYKIPAIRLPILAHALKTTVEYIRGETDDPYGDADFEKRLARVEALVGALADDRVSGEQSARAGFDAVAKLVSALTKDLERRLDAQAETLSTLHAQGQGKLAAKIDVARIRRTAEVPYRAVEAVDHPAHLGDSLACHDPCRLPCSHPCRRRYRADYSMRLSPLRVLQTGP